MSLCLTSATLTGMSAHSGCIPLTSGVLGQRGQGELRRLGVDVFSGHDLQPSNGVATGKKKRVGFYESTGPAYAKTLRTIDSRTFCSQNFPRISIEAEGPKTRRPSSETRKKHAMVVAAAFYRQQTVVLDVFASTHRLPSTVWSSKLAVGSNSHVEEVIVKEEPPRGVGIVEAAVRVMAHSVYSAG